jgi:hypothetical protein
VGGVKITQDGSPQGKTAYLAKPYYRVPGNDRYYRGHPILPQSGGVAGAAERTVDINAVISRS